MVKKKIVHEKYMIKKMIEKIPDTKKAKCRECGDIVESFEIENGLCSECWNDNNI